MSLTPLVTSRDHQLGVADALVTLVEYGDYECPHCARAHPVVKEMQRRFGEHLRVVFRNFPLAQVHPFALHAAEAAECVAVHGGEDAFWRMHDALFEHQQDSPTSLADERLAAYAEAVGVDGALVVRDLANQAHLDRVREDFRGGVRSGVNGTPSFFVNGERYDGDWTDAEHFASVLGRAAKERGRSMTGMR
ncbi:DsbA family protein [Gemmatimonas groenlandica]|uniref:DsbA family protein n=1 Tax=Gemmatimonas groenlandica TaxID=2732249 RepID=A0A6M4IHJ9_9BACT|nr:DsbA family protein [Gemmatimonas groenlandica]QJR34060.1 DsbA family protein [Gemmatimonas groenlandica]